MDQLAHDLLDEDAEMRLGREIQAAKMDPSNLRLKRRADRARNTLVEHNLRLAMKYARQYHGVLSGAQGRIEVDDLYQEAVSGLIRAAEKFDPEKGNRFNTYAVFWIKQFIGRYCEYNASSITMPVNQVAEFRSEMKRRRVTDVDVQDLTANSQAVYASMFTSSIDDALQICSTFDTEEQGLLMADTSLLHDVLRGLSQSDRDVLCSYYGIGTERLSCISIAERDGRKAVDVRYDLRQAERRLRSALGRHEVKLSGAFGEGF